MVNKMVFFWHKVEGISLWKINTQLKKLASSKLTIMEQLKDDKIIIHLPTKTKRELTSLEKKRELLKEVESLDGFESLRVCVLESCKPIFKEQLTKVGVYRWIEIPLPNQVHYEYSFAEMKEAIVNNNHQVRPITHEQTVSL